MASLTSLLILGGARSGKSRYALERARTLPGQVAFLATAEALDPEMGERIARHRQARPADWLTVEEPVEVASALRGFEGRADVVVVDCLNLWVSNLMGGSETGDASSFHGHIEELLKVMNARLHHLIVVSNEVGMGVHPEAPLGRRFRDLLGLVNQRVAEVAGEVVLMVAGLPLWLKRP